MSAIAGADGSGRTGAGAGTGAGAPRLAGTGESSESIAGVSFLKTLGLGPGVDCGAGGTGVSGVLFRSGPLNGGGVAVDATGSCSGSGREPASELVENGGGASIEIGSAGSIVSSGPLSGSASSAGVDSAAA